MEKEAVHSFGAPPKKVNSWRSISLEERQMKGWQGIYLSLLRIHINVSSNAGAQLGRLAEVKVDSEFTAPCNTRILYPADGGNMHCFTARTACAVLDVLGPPYCDSEGRHCQYYYDYPFADYTVDGVSVPAEEKSCYAWLEEREKPEDFTVVGALYSGPKIVAK